MDDPVTNGSTPGSTDRTRVRRIPDRAVKETEALRAVLDAGFIAHIAVIDDGQPYVLPVGYARRGDEVIFHGSTGSRLMRSLAAGAPTCLTVTLLDGMVLARSAFESSMNYRSVMVLGVARRLEGDDELDALRHVSDHLLPGRWSDIRPPSPKERAATMTLALSLDECSVKIRTGGPEDDPADLADPRFAPVWAGHVPLTEAFGVPVADEHCVEPDVIPSYIGEWRRP
ncbi:MAG: pyridoxamine 5'-phosphate oxidase family protein [bacterium]|nr:pyridoxamine 5'-phosphate oxidase family protein [bacterium]